MTSLEKILPAKQKRPHPKGNAYPDGYNQCLNDVLNALRGKVVVIPHQLDMINAIKDTQLLDKSRSQSNPRRWNLTRGQAEVIWSAIRSLMLSEEGKA